MSSAPGAAQRELVFCHQCQNEFWKDEHGLVCPDPDCRSEFTEVIQNDTDPRNDEPTADFFGSHNSTFASAPDPDEDDIRRFAWTSGDGRSNISFRATYSTLGDRSGPGAGGGMGPLGLGGLLSAMARPGGPHGFGPPPHHPSDRASSDPGDSGTRGPIGQSHFEFRSNGGNGFMFTSTGAPGNMDDRAQPGRPVPPTAQIDDLQHMLTSIMASMGVRPEAPHLGGHDMAGMPFAQLLNTMFNPAHAQMGNAVFSDEAFDRILSQFMEQHQSGNAPGPASAAAINALPKHPATAKELGDEMQAECSICMDTVTAGVEVSVLPCSHWFHPDCVKSWLSEHDTCPVCRAGITPKDGSRDELREPSQAPLNNEDPVHVARRQSGSQGNPIVVPESPTRERRQPSFRRASSGNVLESIDEGARQGSGEQGGFANRLRGLFGRQPSGSGNNNGSSNSNGNGNSSTSMNPDDSSR